MVPLLVYDLPRSFGQVPKAGELISSISRTDGRTMTVYLIQSAREVQRRVRTDQLRFKLKVRVVDRGDPQGQTQWWLHWNSRQPVRG